MSLGPVAFARSRSSLQVTSIYLRRLEGEADGSWRRVAAAIGV
jgi:hypothetical protein